MTYERCRSKRKVSLRSAVCPHDTHPYFRSTLAALSRRVLWTLLSRGLVSVEGLRRPGRTRPALEAKRRKERRPSRGLQRLSCLFPSHLTLDSHKEDQDPRLRLSLGLCSVSLGTWSGGLLGWAFALGGRPLLIQKSL